MKRFLVLGLLLCQSVFANETDLILKNHTNECKTTTVAVEEIVKNSHIKGHVKGLPTSSYSKFKVVFYVKTDYWYVHPYTYNEGQTEGYSYSNIKEDGTFWVRTLSRDVPSAKLAVVVVPRSYKIKAKKKYFHSFLNIFDGVLKNKCAYTIVPGNGDFFL